MARKIHSRLKIEGNLTTQTALHVGGHGASPDTDLPLAQNGRGNFYIPGTSVAGVIRAWCEKNFGEDESKKIFGFQKDNTGQASFVIVEDIALPQDTQSEIRDGVGIDRFYGTAADQAKFDRAILPKGTELKLGITVEIEDRKRKPKDKRQNEVDLYAETEDEFKARINRMKALFGHALAALQKGRLRFGASRTRGLGRVKAENNFSIKEQKLNSKAGILALLKDNGDSVTVENLQTAHAHTQPNGSSQLEITIEWKPKSALMVKAGYEGIGVDMLPLTSGNGKDNVSLCLPGSSIKGAFRSHAERIVRTLKPQKFPRETDFHKQIKVEIVDELFGAKKETTGQANHLGLGALNIDDCYFGKQMDTADWQAVETGKVTKTVRGKEEDITYTEQELWQALKKIENEPDLASPTKDFSISHHVAIDRWTGGASEGALYSVLQPTAKIGWQDICLTLDLSRLRKADGSPDESLQKKCSMLLLLVLRDFAENRLPLGFATNRGMGEVEAVSFTTEGLYQIEYKDGKFDFKSNANLKGDLEKEWDEWLKN